MRNQIAASISALVVIFIGLGCGKSDVTVVRVLQCPNCQVVAELNERALSSNRLSVIKRVERDWWFDRCDLLIQAIGYDTPKLELVGDSLLFIHILGGPYVLLPLDVPISTLKLEGASDRLNGAISRLAPVDFDSTATCAVGIYRYTPQPHQWLVYAEDLGTKFGKELWLAGASEVTCHFDDSGYVRLAIGWENRPKYDTVQIQLPASQWWHVTEIHVLKE